MSQILTPAAIRAIVAYHEGVAYELVGLQREAEAEGDEANAGRLKKAMLRHKQIAAALKKHGRPVNARTLEPV